MKMRMRVFLAGLVFCWITPCSTLEAASSRPRSHSASRASIAEDPYRSAIVMDAATGRVLFEDRADARCYPASVLKLMDLLIILEQIEQGRLSLQDRAPVSLKAARTAPSRVGLQPGENFTIDELLYALMVHSANDAAVALAERIAGSTDAFIELMNRRARALGMDNTVFHSVHGLPPARGQQDDLTTARDLAVLCREVLKHPLALRYTSTRERVFRPNGGKRAVQMQAHNHLLGQVEGCDGLKTGFIEKAGFSIAVTAKRNGRRVIVVVLDSADRKVRDARAAALLTKGFATLSASPVPTVSKSPPTHASR